MKTLLLSLLALTLVGTAHAETLALKNGSKINGKIVEKTAKKVKIEVDGAAMTYYMDEIDNIDGEAPNIGAAEAKPVTIAPAVINDTPTETPAVAETPVAPETPATPTAPTTPVDGPKRELILKFIDVFGTKAAMTQNLQAMTDSLPADNPEYAKIKKGINVDEIIDRLVPIYDKHFTEAELNDYIDFYSSPKGKKLIDAISKIMKESVDVSAQYFQEKFPESAQ